jgi:peptidoglycan-associated lipoprotein
MRSVSVVAALLLIVACSHAQAPKSESPAAPAEKAAPAEASTQSDTKACSADAQCGGSQLCVDSRCVDITPGLAACNDIAVHFGFDESTLQATDLAALQRAARCLSAASATKVVIDGNADERGTTEYNLALGDRRATAVKHYLESLGVSGTNLRTVSYGKERPVCTEHDESCWAKNRRAEIQRGDGSTPSALR